MATRSAATPATRELTRLGIAFTMHPYHHDPAERSFGEEAARNLGLRNCEVFKTLIVMVDGSPAVAVLPVSGPLDLKVFAHACNGRRAELAQPALAQRITGYVVGGISPIGLKRAIRTIVDEQSSLLDVVYVSGGRRGLNIGLKPEDLVLAVQAKVAAIARAETA